jgi:hypothetical protein
MVDYPGKQPPCHDYLGDLSPAMWSFNLQKPLLPLWRFQEFLELCVRKWGTSLSLCLCLSLSLSLYTYIYIYIYIYTFTKSQQEIGICCPREKATLLLSGNARPPLRNVGSVHWYQIDKSGRGLFVLSLQTPPMDKMCHFCHHVRIFISLAHGHGISNSGGLVAFC